MNQLFSFHKIHWRNKKVKREKASLLIMKMAENGGSAYCSSSFPAKSWAMCSLQVSWSIISFNFTKQQKIRRVQPLAIQKKLRRKMKSVKKQFPTGLSQGFLSMVVVGICPDWLLCNILKTRMMSLWFRIGEWLHSRCTGRKKGGHESQLPRESSKIYCKI